MKYACVYCGKEVPEGCPHENVFSCCGEVGHVEPVIEEVPVDELLALPLPIPAILPHPTRE